MEKLKLRLQRVNVNVWSRLVGKRAEDVDFRHAGARGIAAEGSVGSHSKSKIWIRWIAIGLPAGAKCVLDVGTRRRADDGPRIEETANAGLREEGSVLAHIGIKSSEGAIVQDAKSAAEYGLVSPDTRTVGESNPWAEILLVGVIELADSLDAPVKEAVRPKDIVAQPILGFGNGRKIFPAQAQIDSQIRTNLPVVLDEQGISRGRHWQNSTSRGTDSWGVRSRSHCRCSARE